MLPTSVRIMVCTQAQDMRRSFDTLALVVRQHLGGGPAERLTLRVRRQATDAGEGPLVGPQRVLPPLQATPPRPVRRAPGLGRHTVDPDQRECAR